MFGIGNTEIAPKELKRRLDGGEKLPVLDVREDKELAICKLDHTLHIPMESCRRESLNWSPTRDKRLSSCAAPADEAVNASSTCASWASTQLTSQEAYLLGLKMSTRL